MAGYSGTPLPKKLGINDGTRLALLASPKGFKGQLDDRARLLLLSGAVPVLIFTAISFRSIVKINWLAPAYWSLMILGVHHALSLDNGLTRFLRGLGSSAAILLKNSYWSFRDQQFGFSLFLDREIPHLPPRLRYLQDLQQKGLENNGGFASTRSNGVRSATMKALAS